MARMVAAGDHLRPSDLDPTLIDLDELVLKAVSPDPGKRFSSAEDLRDALQMALAKKSPTLTSDRLGAFMRDLFAEELAEEREALRQARAVDLSSFATELEGGKTETVTFAAADEEVSGIRTGFRKGINLPPLPAPPEEDEPVEEAPPLTTSSKETDRPVLVDSTIDEPARRSRFPLYAAGLAGVALAIFVVSRMGGESPPPPAPAPPAAAEPPAPRVQPFVVQPIPIPAPIAIVVPDAATPAAARPGEKPRLPPPRPSVRPSEPASEAPTAASVTAKYQAVSRDYSEFRKAYGSRLEAEWNDILDFATYGAGEDKQAKLDAKLTQFKKRMAAVRAGN
jgi:hypothetical protein